MERIFTNPEIRKAISDSIPENVCKNNFSQWMLPAASHNRRHFRQSHGWMGYLRL